MKVNNFTIRFENSIYLDWGGHLYPRIEYKVMGGMKTIDINRTKKGRLHCCLKWLGWEIGSRISLDNKISIEKGKVLMFIDFDNLTLTSEKNGVPNKVNENVYKKIKDEFLSDVNYKKWQEKQRKFDMKLRGSSYTHDASGLIPIIIIVWVFIFITYIHWLWGG